VEFAEEFAAVGGVGVVGLVVAEEIPDGRESGVGLVEVKFDFGGRG